MERKVEEMDNLEFNKQLINYANTLNIVISEEQANQFYKYMQLLLDWNNKINLTAITDEKEIIIKHFIDSISVNKYIENQGKVMDIGTGAGFPGIPLKIIEPKTEFILVDSLNKRINFLEEVKEKLNLQKVTNIHSRVEDLAHNAKYREQANVVLSRAVANLSVLAEYMLPFVKKGGYCICMKGPNINEEVKTAEKAINILGGKIEKIENFILPYEEEKIERNVVIIKKVNTTEAKYPRKAGIPSKQPL